MFLLCDVPSAVSIASISALKESSVSSVTSYPMTAGTARKSAKIADFMVESSASRNNLVSRSKKWTSPTWNSDRSADAGFADFSRQCCQQILRKNTH